MAFKIFSVPIQNGETAEGELNGFLQSHTILSVERQLVQQGPTWFWSFCVDYLDAKASGGKGSRQSAKRPQVDYREVLNDEDFAIFTKLRELRKEIAHSDGVPVYNVFNNEQLAQMVQNRVRTRTDFKTIKGAGDARFEKYGDRFLEFLNGQWDHNDETHREPVRADR